MIIGAILGILQAGLSLWQSKEKRKYVDEAMKIQKEYYEEINKPAAERSDAVLDHLEFRLRVLALGFAADVARENPQN